VGEKPGNAISVSEEMGMGSVRLSGLQILATEGQLFVNQAHRVCREVQGQVLPLYDGVFLDYHNHPVLAGWKIDRQ
jgi:hypothetical protein